MRVAFAGDRQIAVDVLDYLLDSGTRPAALLVSGDDRATHADALIRRCDHLPGDLVLRGTAFRSEQAVARLRDLGLDLIVCVHFPYIVPADVLDVPRIGVLNLHPAYLPWNRGWHTPSWAILEDTPAGATLHFMDEGLDTGDIVHQKRVEVSPADTAHSLYQRILHLELDVFREAWPRLVDGTFTRTPQEPGQGTAHRREELLRDEVRRIDPDEPVPPRALLRRLRALTTDRAGEAAFMDLDGRRILVRVRLDETDAS